MPANQSSWFDYDQGAAPIEKASELGKDEAIRSCCRVLSGNSAVNGVSDLGGCYLRRYADDINVKSEPVWSHLSFGHYAMES